MKPVIKEENAITYVSDAQMIRFISTNAPMDWNECCDFVRKHDITNSDDNGGALWDDSILKRPQDYNDEQVKWITAFFQAHPFIKKMMVVFDD